jgi:hypothetical protein
LDLQLVDHMDEVLLLALGPEPPQPARRAARPAKPRTRPASRA